MVKKNKCLECYNQYTLTSTEGFNDKFCHVRCKYAQEKRLAVEKRAKDKLENSPIVKCLHCSRTFTKISKKQKFCSQNCMDNAKAEQIADKWITKKEPKLSQYKLDRKKEYERILEKTKIK